MVFTFESSTIPNSVSVKSLVKNQADVEIFLQNRLRNIIESNAPPKKWGAFAEELPASIRKKFVLDLLSNNKSNPEKLIWIISELTPTAGSKDAVIKFLSDYLEDHEFSSGDISKMFSGSRFSSFFDTDASVLNIMTPRQLKLAVKTHVTTAAKDGLQAQFLNPAYSNPKARVIESEYVQNREELKAILGFSPIRVPVNLQDQINSGFKGPAMPESISDQTRGVIVQGAYNRDGFILTEKLGTRRGMAQVEKDVPGMVKALKISLAQGTLKGLNELDQRLFVDNWSLNSDPGLIKNIRQRALVVAEMDPAFKPLRIEIHAFPNADVLYRTKQYVDNYKKNKPNAKTLAEFNLLIAEIEELINPKDANGTLKALVEEKLKADREIVTALSQASHNYESLPSWEKLRVLIKVRQVWKEQKLARSSTDARFFYFIGDRALADMAIAEAAKAMTFLTENPEQQVLQTLNVSWSLLDHMGLDNMLAANQIEAIKNEATEIYHDAGLNVDKKLEMLAGLLSNSVDQVYYLLNRNYGEFDEKVLRLVTRGTDRPPVRFIDATLRSNSVFMLSQLVDYVETSALKRKNVSIELNNRPFKVTGQVFNPGMAEGIIRVNADPLELTSEEIGVFSEMPIESGALSGIITLGIGARLSHLQLLAKALQIPNVKFSPEALKELEKLEGKRIRLVADKKGNISVTVLDSAKKASVAAANTNKIEVPVPDYRADKPISFTDGKSLQNYTIAGPKGMILMKLFNTPETKDWGKDGFMLGFGFYRRYLKQTGIVDAVDQLEKVDIENVHLIAFLTAKIRQHFAENPVPKDMLGEVMAELKALQKRTGHKAGYFFRSDTNIEDLPGFNGAGLNESVANVAMTPKEVDGAIRTVWASAFKEKSIMWRARALNAKTVPVAVPSQVILPTVFATSSGVLLTKGGDDFKEGKGIISANWGIGSVVEAGAPTEEISLEGKKPHRYSLTSSNVKPSAKPGGGIIRVPIQPGLPVLSDKEINDLNEKGMVIERVLGSEKKGWDVEWAVDEKGRSIILQSRPVN